MDSKTDVPVHPVQVSPSRAYQKAQAPTCLTLRAYEVYSHVYARQEAMITGGCRGGFGIGELMAFLYARSFPKEEWSKRIDEALTGLRMP